MHSAIFSPVRLAVSLIAFVVAACGPDAPKSATQAGTSTGDEITGSGNASTVGEVPTTGTTATGTLGPDTTTCQGECGETGSSGSPGQLDMGTRSCNILAQDCPTGQKCAPLAKRDGIIWDTAECIPVAERPRQLGEPCSFQDGNPFSGKDNCDVGAICWEGDHGGRGEFRCAALCSGTFESPVCAPGTFCSIFWEWLAVCEEPACDPVAQDCPDQEELCIPNIYLWEDWCIPDESDLDGQVHAPCESQTECGKGLNCIAAELAALECDLRASGCCQPFCEFGSLCAGEGQECSQYYDINLGFGICKLP